MQCKSISRLFFFVLLSLSVTACYEEELNLNMEYVIEEQDTAGGTGANFIVNWAATSSEANPLFEGIMISTNGQQGISFSTQGVSISKRK